MKNLKKLNRNELKTISGNGLLDNIGGLVGGLDGAVGGVVSVHYVKCSVRLMA